MKGVRVPNDSHRHVIVGQTGTGKTVLGAYFLAHRSYDVMPWYIINYKGDDYLDQIPHEELRVTDPIPDHPGIYMVRPECEPGSIDGLLERAHKRGGGVGFLIDEATEVGQHSAAYRRVQVQGRSMCIPTISCSQRPKWLNRYVFTEMTFMNVYPLLALDDRKTIIDWLPEKTAHGNPIDVNYPETLPEYHSLYFDAGTRSARLMAPVPYGDKVLEIFDRRVPKKTKAI